MNINRRHLAAASAGAFSALAIGAAPALAAGADAAVSDAVEAYRKGLLSADRKQLEALCADALTYGHSSGRVQNKAEFIAGATDPKTTWKSITFIDQTNQVAGSNAMSRFIFTGENESEGKTSSLKFGVLIVWVEEHGQWRMLARQGYKI